MNEVGVTHHPPAAPRAEKGSADRRRVLVLGIVISTVLHLVLAGGVALALSVRGAQTPPPEALEQPAATPATASSESAEVDLAPLYMALNEALAARDREAFMGHVTGAAVEPLTLWWDNMDALGWTTGTISPADDAGGVHTSADGGEIVVVLGADMGHRQRVSENSTAGGGPLMTLGSFYVATVEASAERVALSGWRPEGAPRPWDDGPLAVAVEDGVVVAGPRGEEDLVAEIATIGSSTSAWIRDDYAAAQGRSAPLDGFVVFATSEEAAIFRWADAAEVDLLASSPFGFTFAGHLPRRESPGLSPDVATSALSNGALVALGPNSATSGALDAILAHEFTHALQFLDHPGTWTVNYPALAIEGWATHQEIMFMTGGVYPTSGTAATFLSGCTGGQPPTVPTDDEVMEDETGCASSIASTIFVFAELNGIEPVTLSDLSMHHGVTPFGAAQRLGTPLSGDAWSAWFAETYL